MFTCLSSFCSTEVELCHLLLPPHLQHVPNVLNVTSTKRDGRDRPCAEKADRLYHHVADLVIHFTFCAYDKELLQTPVYFLQVIDRRLAHPSVLNVGFLHPSLFRLYVFDRSHHVTVKCYDPYTWSREDRCECFAVMSWVSLLPNLTMALWSVDADVPFVTVLFLQSPHERDTLP